MVLGLSFAPRSSFKLQASRHVLPLPQSQPLEPPLQPHPGSDTAGSAVRPDAGRPSPTGWGGPEHLLGLLPSPSRPHQRHRGRGRGDPGHAGPVVADDQERGPAVSPVMVRFVPS